MPYYSVQVTYRQEVCVKAKDEAEAEEIARKADFDVIMLQIEDVEAGCEYDEKEEADIIQEFKNQNKYAE